MANRTLGWCLFSTNIWYIICCIYCFIWSQDLTKCHNCPHKETSPSTAVTLSEIKSSDGCTWYQPHSLDQLKSVLSKVSACVTAVSHVPSRPSMQNLVWKWRLHNHPQSYCDFATIVLVSSTDLCCMHWNNLTKINNVSLAETMSLVRLIENVGNHCLLSFATLEE